MFSVRVFSQTYSVESYVTFRSSGQAAEELDVLYHAQKLTLPERDQFMEFVQADLTQVTKNNQVIFERTKV
jgi:RecJ-like exonuclease